MGSKCSVAGTLASMAVGKNKRLTKGKKGSKKKLIDPFTTKDWYDIKAPSIFQKPICGKTLITRTKGTKIASEGLKGRQVEVSLGDLQNNEDDAYRKINLRVEDVQGKNVLCNFCIAFTKKQQFQIRKTSYAQSAQIRAIRKKMTDIMTKEVSSCEMIKAVEKFVPESIGKDIRKACEGIYPLQNVFIRKVKILKAPKFDAAKLAEIHSGPTGDDVGAKIAREAKEEMKESETAN